MNDVVVVNHVSLDGVMQSPARPDEDTRDGFTSGGWAIPGADEVMGRVLGARMAAGPGGALLLGRRIYEDFASVWPQRSGDPHAAVLEASPKYVASTTLHEPLPWANSHVLAGPLGPAVRDLATRHTGVCVLGSGDLIASLLEQDLVDEWLLLIHPLVLGKGRHLFGPGAAASLALIDSVTTTTGVIIATYRRA
jgi:dihydrofolate reductase